MENAPPTLICPLTAAQTDAALALALRVFLRFEAPACGPEGVGSFRRSLADRNFVGRLAFWGAWEDGRLVGMGATRNAGGHVALLFVEGDCQSRGIGRELLSVVLAHAPGPAVTVNSAPGAVGFYRRAGFEPTGEERRADGIRFVPMEWRKRS